jgi:hypothetical protein
MRHLQSFKIFESAETLTQEQRELLDSCVVFANSWSVSPEGKINFANSWSVSPEGKINVKGSFLAQEEGLTDFKGLEFGEVDGNFRCENNSITSLKGSPAEVELGFYCYNNRITSLEGGPEKVGKNYDCDPNENLVSLVGAPIYVGGIFTAPEIRIPEGGWNPQGIFEVFKKTKNARCKTLLGTIMGTHVGREILQAEVDADPAGMMRVLRDYLAEDWLKGMKLVWPESTRDYVQALTDLGEIGF